MTTRTDTSIWLQDVPTVRAQALRPMAGSDEDRAVISIDDVLVVFGTVDTLRATLTDALAQLVALPAGGAE